MNTELGNKIEGLLNELGFSEDEKAYFYISTMQYVSRELDDLFDEILTDEDFDTLEQMDDPDQIEAYLAEKVKDTTGKDVNELSDELMHEYLEKVQEVGIKELMSNQPEPSDS